MCGGAGSSSKEKMNVPQHTQPQRAQTRGESLPSPHSWAVRAAACGCFSLDTAPLPPAFHLSNQKLARPDGGKTSTVRQLSSSRAGMADYGQIWPAASQKRTSLPEQARSSSGLHADLIGIEKPTRNPAAEVSTRRRRLPLVSIYH